LMAAHQFPECLRILLRHHLSDQFIVANPWRPRVFADGNDYFRVP
jgi:hypothetical protein